jgi:hypothetical protein
MQRICTAVGCERPATIESDECEEHLLDYEEKMAEIGYTTAPCKFGHYTCAHLEDGRCHAKAKGCPDMRSDCEWLLGVEE